ncbi:MAG: hypothetical protein Q8S02_07960 [Hydrogenophaga sp.]|nr:hypothetical protein [Hydrogenophaga sp.]
MKQALGAGFNALVSLALVLWLARVMGVESFGHYVAVLSGATVGLIVLEGGWSALLYRECAAGRAGHAVMAHATAHVVWTGGLAVLMCLMWWVADKQAMAWAAAWGCMALVALMNLVSARLRGMGSFGREALWQAAGRLVSALMVWAWVGVVALPPQPEVVFAAWALGLLCVLVLARAWLAWPLWRGLWNAYPRTMPLVASALSMAWLLKGDMVLLSGWAMGAEGAPIAAADLSLYAASTRLTEMGLLLFAPVSNVLLRLFVAPPEADVSAPAHKGHQPATWLWRVMSLVGMCGAALVFVAIWLGAELMHALFGAAYVPAGSFLPWVLLMLPAACGNLVWIQWWMAQHAEQMAARWLVLAGLVLWLVTPWAAQVGGVTAAAAAVALVHAVLWLVYAGAYWRRRRSG